MIVTGNERQKRSQLLKEIIAVADGALSLVNKLPSLDGIDAKDAIAVRSLLLLLESQIPDLQHHAKIGSALVAKALDLQFDIMALPSCQLAEMFLGPDLQRKELMRSCVRLITFFQNLYDFNLSIQSRMNAAIARLRNADLDAIV